MLCKFFSLLSLIRTVFPSNTVYLDSPHNRVITILHELNTEFLQKDPYTEGGATRHVLLRDWSTILRSLLSRLQSILEIEIKAK